MKGEKSLKRILVVCLCVHAVCLRASSVPETWLGASDAEAYDNFGYSVAADGALTVIGATGDDDMGSAAGAAYVFERSGDVWTQTAKLTAADGTNSDYFGRSVAISGGRIVVGADSDDDAGSNSGSAYVFEEVEGVWTQTVKLAASDGAAGDYFGCCVAVESNRIVVGAYCDDDRGSSSGAAYVFERVDGVWTQTVKLTAADGSSFDYFGRAVAMSDGRIVVAAERAAGASATDAGGVYVFGESGGVWTQVAKLAASDGANYDYFGCTVSISGNRIVVGAYRDDDAGTDSGSAYVFECAAGVWQQAAKLAAGDGAAFDGFGRSVAISGTNVLAGAYQDNDSGSVSGSAYVFRKTVSGWMQAGKLRASDGATGDRLGWSASLAGHDALCGAYYATRDGLTACGAAYVFDTGKMTNTVPVVRDQTISLVAEGECYIDLDFSDPDGQAMTFRIVLSPTNGALESYEDRHGTTAYRGRYYYSWDGVSKPDTFTWEVTDGQGTSAVATVTI